MLPDGNSYGRRIKDDCEVVKRVIQKLQADDEKRPLAAETPAWARDLQQAHPDSVSLNGSVGRSMSELQPFSFDEETEPVLDGQDRHAATS